MPQTLPPALRRQLISCSRSSFRRTAGAVRTSAMGFHGVAGSAGFSSSFAIVTGSKWIVDFELKGFDFAVFDADFVRAFGALPSLGRSGRLRRFSLGFARPSFGSSPSFRPAFGFCVLALSFVSALDTSDRPMSMGVSILNGLPIVSASAAFTTLLSPVELPRVFRRALIHPSSLG